MGKYILAIDQSTQATKAILFDEKGKIKSKCVLPHHQIVNDIGYVEHDPIEIWDNVLSSAKTVIEEAKIQKEEVASIALSNQRETSLAWNKKTGEPIYNAIVWQCARAKEICKRHQDLGENEYITKTTGIPLSPYFPAPKFQWILENVPLASELASKNELALGTIDSWLIYCLSGKKIHKCDYSNASRTQLFNVDKLCWEEKLCDLFHIPVSSLPEICDSDSIFTETDLDGYLLKKIPVLGVLGDSHAALFGQNCLKAGEIKATYGTGSSVMMNAGEHYKAPSTGLVVSLAWKIKGKVNYVYEGNLNYTGAVISWLKDNIELISSPSETSELAQKANPLDKTYFVPAFTGLGAPYWKPEAKALFYGISRTTGKNELVKAGLESIAYQINDLIELMRKESGQSILRLHVDGGPTENAYLMQFQADIAKTEIIIPELQELSAMGVAYLSGISLGIYDQEKIFASIAHHSYYSKAEEGNRKAKIEGWKKAIEKSF